LPSAHERSKLQTFFLKDFSFEFYFCIIQFIVYLFLRPSHPESSLFCLMYLVQRSWASSRYPQPYMGLEQQALIYNRPKPKSSNIGMKRQ